MRHLPLVLLLLTVSCLTGFAQKKKAAQPSTDALKKEALQAIDQRYADYREVAQQIWNYAELGYKEEKSSALLKSVLEKEGFRIESGVAGIPTAFVASFGSGSPVIGILAEYD